VINQLGRIDVDGVFNFSKDIVMGHYERISVIIDLCLQIAYYMGFKEVYLLGCDCDYTGLQRWDGLMTENKGGYGLPDGAGEWEVVFKAYQKCKDVFEEDGRKIYNSTVGGKLEVFERRKLEDVCRKR